MARTPKLKVFTTPIGFHDVYVAAPSRAAALRAWGSERDLFARGLASEVSDPELIAEALAKPGEVIRHLRGSEAEQFAELSKMDKDHPQKADSPPKKPAKPKPRPSRTAVTEAEAALNAAESRHHAEDGEAKARVEEAQRQRRELQRRHAAERRDLQSALDEAQDRYDRAIERWRSDA
ncbi:hypothetical protein [Sphingomonas sp. Marseille-Q8236]